MYHTLLLLFNLRPLHNPCVPATGDGFPIQLYSHHDDRRGLKLNLDRGRY